MALQHIEWGKATSWFERVLFSRLVGEGEIVEIPGF
jgi:hypothetical protein